ncbi:aminoglycoside adenylyltransferase domain-containing protein [Paenibacillus eucommiae]|uniref:Spectinomycin 9-adenylyltransferase n=1 Tax=Paenibacillus eucommiae TaxID=1355755 RepID=A0ABS4J3N1_9BACL|nr:aminoglycoside adenylyltransferase domain-containing protein [Paenibacillus eucommiae]MBP1994410.1 streptomycin 3'-adenylyltransferase [Paenibacillus eucommiae]
MDTQVKRHLDTFTALFVEELKENLSGIYLHGSLAMGCFNPSRSDIDLLVVVKRKLSRTGIKRIVRDVLVLHEGMTNGLEFSVILDENLALFDYPTPFELHYSDYHREKYRTDDHYVCGGDKDRDLASQITIAYHRGITLYGKPLAELYPPIERRYYLASILHDVEGAPKEIISNPIYVTLNLCRVLLYIREGKLSSKREGGEWGITHLPIQYRDLVQSYLNEYNGAIGHNKVEPLQLSEFAAYMLNTIKKEI